jgi:hypothetical protein
MPTKIALATKHGKFAQIAPWFEQLSEFELVLAEIDTDQFGTFSGEIPRTLSPRDAAIAKARAGAEWAGSDFGLASEGSVGPHPQFPWVNADHEVLALVCLSRDFAVVESFVSTEIFAKSESITASDQLEGIGQRFDLPQNAAIVSWRFGNQVEVRKGLTDAAELESLLAELLAQGASAIKVESDLRAMHSPSRQRNIEQCAQRLVARIASRCPGCNEIGWGRIGFEYGLPCGDCFEIVEAAAHSERFGCVACDHTETISLGLETIDAARCNYCNP